MRWLALDAFVWSRPIGRTFVHSIFDRDHADCMERHVVDAFADAILALDDSMPTGTYIDMCAHLPVVDPERIMVPTMIMSVRRHCRDQMI